MSGADLAERTRLRLRAIEEIPTLPAVLLRIWDLTSHADTSAEELARALEADPGLTGSVLRLANSAYFGFPKKVSTIKQAVVVLGFETVRNLATGASVFRALRSNDGGIDADEFLRHGIATAIAARMTIEKQVPHKAGIAFCAGVLHDLGKLVTAEFLPDSWNQIRAAAERGLGNEEAEREVLGLTHAEIGEWFAQRWSFPEELAAAVRWHHDPAAAEAHLECVAAVHLGDVIAHRCGAAGVGRRDPPEPSADALARVGMAEADLADLVEQVAEMVADPEAVRMTLGV